ncbi:NAD(P)/FAD-dependent oxidoreductase [Myxococcus sp. AM001]|nr:NAD(P)/FAD-dependent oxidoreductase [Myxococcus sp. AM001]
MSPSPNRPHVRIAIVGSGFGGLGMAIRLKQEGIEDFVILEREATLGGVWRDNTYPGCACDVPSQLYAFSFAPNPDWSRAFSPQAEIHAYLRACADRYGLHPHLRFHHALIEARWDEHAQRWLLQTSAGHSTADVLISAVGGLNEPAIPDLPGLETFEGKVMHSARWAADPALAGRRVAVIGTGASAVQFIPHIQPEVERLLLFQRTPAWVMPRRDHAMGAVARWLFRHVPGAQRLWRWTLHGVRELSVLAFQHPWLLRLAQRRALRHLRRSVADPVLREKLTPRYVMGCKRILLSDDYFPALTQRNVEVLTSGIQAVRARSIVTRDGVEHAVDTLILGTGFRVTDAPIAHHIRGRGGRTLAQAWGGTMTAHLGTTVSGFPNLFMLLGPNTGLGHTSIILMIESQVEHVLGALRYLDGRALAAVEPSPDAQAEYVRQLDARMAGTVWAKGGCVSWYQDATGRISTLWPGSTLAFRRRVARFEPFEYVAISRRRPPG